MRSVYNDMKKNSLCAAVHTRIIALKLPKVDFGVNQMCGHISVAKYARINQCSQNMLAQSSFGHLKVCFKHQLSHMTFRNR